MSEEQTTFKVTDRRLFNADGTPRDLSPEERQEALAAPIGVTTSGDREPSVTATPDSESAAQPQSPQRSTRPEANERETLDDEPADARDPASFVNFLMSIASNAASALGMMEHPVTHEREVDLELAKHWVDILGMLQRKTLGNLNPREAQILEGLLSDLRMQYVSLANSPQSPGARPLTGRDIIGGK
jgi:hypothetical protein